MAEYTVRCECGRGVTVSGPAAGGEVACGCGRRVAVPSLSQLRADAGEGTASPELVIQASLADSTLPVEADCVGCGVVDAPVGYVPVECERTGVSSNMASLVVAFMLGLAVGWLFVARRRDHPVRGRNVAFWLPVRVCPTCAGSARPRDLLGRTPLYGRLLAKYPHARVGRLVFG